MTMTSLLLIAPAAAAMIALPPVHSSGTAQDMTGVEIVETETDRDRRMTVPVHIGKNGPYRFVIDTGSQVTVLSDGLAQQLALPLGRKRRITGIAGSETVDTVLVGEIGMGRRTMQDMVAPMLESRHIGADGIVGLNSLQGQRIVIDFARNQIALGDAKSTGGSSGFEIVVTARRRAGQLIMTDATIDGIRVNVVIDTGAETTIGNRALQRALTQRGMLHQVKLVSVTGQEIIADLGSARKLTVDNFDITNLIIAYADAPPFRVLGLERRPAILLGMRELRLFQRVAIDFSTRKVYFDLPKGS